MKNYITFYLACLISFTGLAQEEKCATLTFNSFEKVSDQKDQLSINVSVKNEGNSLLGISYPGFMLINETGDTLAYTTSEFATYGIYGNDDFKLKIVKELPLEFSGTIEVYEGFLGRELRNKICTKSVRFNHGKIEEDFIIETTATVSVDNAIYLEYKGNENRGDGRIKKVKANEWYEYGSQSSAIINVYKETHRDERYIYLINGDAIFQFDIARNKIMKNGKDILEVTMVSNKDIKVKSSLSHFKKE